MFEQIMRKFVAWLDPKLEKYRERHPQPKPEPTHCTPKTLEDFIDVIKYTPKSVLSSQDRNRIAAVMNFDNSTVQNLMAPKDQMIFVNQKEILGPLILDKLYKSGFTIFPVVDNQNKVKGVIHTDSLNALEIKKTDRADKYLDPNFSYLNTTDSLQTAIDKINKTGSCYFLVLDNNKSLAGFFTVQILLDYLLNLWYNILYENFI